MGFDCVEICDDVVRPRRQPAGCASLPIDRHRARLRDRSSTSARGLRDCEGCRGSRAWPPARRRASGGASNCRWPLCSTLAHAEMAFDVAGGEAALRLTDVDRAIVRRLAEPELLTSSRRGVERVEPRMAGLLRIGGGGADGRALEVPRRLCERAPCRATSSRLPRWRCYREQTARSQRRTSWRTRRDVRWNRSQFATAHAHIATILCQLSTKAAARLVECPAHVVRSGDRWRTPFPSPKPPYSTCPPTS